MMPPVVFAVGDQVIRDCPSTPNCVCSLASREAQRILPLRLSTPDAKLIEKVASALNSMPGTRVECQTDYYLHVTFRTRWLGFVDDVEFIMDAPRNLVHLRSASRLGYSDLGVNRRRMNSITELLSSQIPALQSIE
ncbi:MAG: DUF1499 domain-containing protein [Planctomycetales bacterium]|nr:DUF1499 domain-containing protein [Planctomycetales bacterium]